jgi:endonuclease/exonuclease/phosphatase family metal-dependent hydrolase
MKKLLNHNRIISIFLAIFILVASSSYLFGKEKKEGDLVIRTINVHHGAAAYPLRLHGIAQELYRDYPAQIGLIGIQELAKGKMTDCLRGGFYDNGAGCLASEFTFLYGQKAEARIPEKNWWEDIREGLGIIADDNWKIIDTKSWSLGNDRTLMEVFLEHKTKGYKLRFYNTHFSSNVGVKWYQKLLYGYKSSRDEGEKRRIVQARKLIRIVMERAKPGELPPVVVGDFNAGRNFVRGKAEASVRKMEKHFWQPLDNFSSSCTGYTVRDLIYIGKKESFPYSRGRFQLVRWHRVLMHRKPVVVNGTRLDELTDHNAEGFSFNILVTPNK